MASLACLGSCNGATSLVVTVVSLLLLLTAYCVVVVGAAAAAGSVVPNKSNLYRFVKDRNRWKERGWCCEEERGIGMDRMDERMVKFDLRNAISENIALIPPYLQPGNHQFLFGANFSSGGAGALDQTYPGLVVNLRTQLSQFKNVVKQLTQQLGDTEAAELLSDSVYMISIGGNDYLSPARGDSKQPYTRQQFVDMVIGNFTTVIKEIYKKGGRKFSFLSLPPLGCWPSIKAQRAGKSSNTCDEDLAALVQQHMEAFSKNLNKLEKQLKGVEYSYFDLHTCFSDKMANPSKYGFKDGSSACCGSGPYRGVYSCGGMRGEKEYELCENVSDYLFFDSNHPTQVAYQQLAKLMWEGSPIVTGPNNLKSLFQVSNK